MIPNLAISITFNVQEYVITVCNFGWKQRPKRKCEKKKLKFYKLIEVEFDIKLKKNSVKLIHNMQ